MGGFVDRKDLAQYEHDYCTRCANQTERGCPVFLLHASALSTPLDGLSIACNMLIPLTAKGNGECRMFRSLDILLTGTEVAERFGVSKATLSKWRKTGEGPAFIKVNSKCFRYRLRDVIAWERENRTGD